MLSFSEWIQPFAKRLFQFLQRISRSRETHIILREIAILYAYRLAMVVLLPLSAVPIVRSLRYINVSEVVQFYIVLCYILAFIIVAFLVVERRFVGVPQNIHPHIHTALAVSFWEDLFLRATTTRVALTVFISCVFIVATLFEFLIFSYWSYMLVGALLFGAILGYLYRILFISYLNRSSPQHFRKAGFFLAVLPGALIVPWLLSREPVPTILPTGFAAGVLIHVLRAYRANRALAGKRNATLALWDDHFPLSTRDRQSRVAADVVVKVFERLLTGSPRQARLAEHELKTNHERLVSSADEDLEFTKHYFVNLSRAKLLQRDFRAVGAIFNEASNKFGVTSQRLISAYAQSLVLLHQYSEARDILRSALKHNEPQHPANVYLVARLAETHAATAMAERKIEELDVGIQYLGHAVASYSQGGVLHVQLIYYMALRALLGTLYGVGNSGSLELEARARDEIARYERVAKTSDIHKRFPDPALLETFAKAFVGYGEARANYAELISRKIEDTFNTLIYTGLGLLSEKQRLYSDAEVYYFRALKEGDSVLDPLSSNLAIWRYRLLEQQKS